MRPSSAKNPVHLIVLHTDKFEVETNQPFYSEHTEKPLTQTYRSSKACSCVANITKGPKRLRQRRTCAVTKTGALQICAKRKQLQATSENEVRHSQKQTATCATKKVTWPSLFFLAQWRFHSGLVKGPKHTCVKPKAGYAIQAKRTSSKKDRGGGGHKKRIT